MAASTIYIRADRVRSKLGVSTLADAARYAREWGRVEQSARLARRLSKWKVRSFAS